MSQAHQFPDDVDVSAGDTFRWTTSFPKVPDADPKTREGTVTRVMNDDHWDKMFYVTQDDEDEHYHGHRWEVHLSVPNARNTDVSFYDDIDSYEINPENN